MTVAEEHVLFVHAHPDDESISTGGTIAHLILGGHRVTVVVCTRGELGEVIPAHLQHLLEPQESRSANRSVGSDSLGEYRSGELANAMRALGVEDYRFLGSETARAPGAPTRRYRDSGMRWGGAGAETPQVLDPRSLAAAPLAEVTADVAAVVAQVNPTAIVSYDARGGYGHPDHIRAREAALAAAQAAGVPFFEIVEGHGPQTGHQLGDIVTDVRPVLDAKRKALLAHATQVTVVGDEFELSNGVRRPIALTEVRRQVPGKIDHVPAVKGSSIQ